MSGQVNEGSNAGSHEVGSVGVSQNLSDTLGVVLGGTMTGYSGSKRKISSINPPFTGVSDNVYKRVCPDGVGSSATRHFEAINVVAPTNVAPLMPPTGYMFVKIFIF